MNKNKHLLFIAPEFMMFEKIIINSLIDKYEVTYINHSLFENGFRLFYGKSLFRKFLRKILRVLRLSYFINTSKFVTEEFNISYEENFYDVVFVIRGDYFPFQIYKKLRKRNKTSYFVLYEWDDISRLFRKNFFHFFDKKYSYCIDDCKKYNFDYLPMFSEFHASGKSKRIYDISFVASANNLKRLEIIKKIYSQNKDKYDFFIYIYQKNGNCNFFNHKEPLSYDKYMDIIRKSKATIEIPVSGQKGPTTRAIDTFACRTKLITTNSNIKKYPFYSSNNILILRKNLVIPYDFINSTFSDTTCIPLDASQFIKALGI